MPEQELNPAASKFISSLVKSLQIICNGHVDFNESIELVGHINLRVDNKFKFDYIVDEQVSKIGEDCSTTFRSNSYHSSPPPRDTFVKDGLQIEADLSLASLQTTSSCFKTHGSQPSGLGKSVTDMRSNEDVECNYDVNVESLKEHDSDKDKIVFKLEGGDDSNECIILSSTSGDLEPPYDMNDAEAIASGSTKDSHGELRTRKRQKTSHGPEEVPETKADVTFPMGLRHIPETDLQYSYSIDDTDHSFHTSAQFQMTTASESPHSGNHVRPFHCKFCLLAWTSWDEYKQHMCHAHSYSACKLCRTLCPSKRALNGHRDREHTPKFVCPICSKTFHCKRNYSGHMNMHSGNKPYACSRSCGKTFAYPQSKDAHEKLCTVAYQHS